MVIGVGGEIHLSFNYHPKFVCNLVTQWQNIFFLINIYQSSFCLTGEILKGRYPDLGQVFQMNTLVLLKKLHVQNTSWRSDKLLNNCKIPLFIDILLPLIHKIRPMKDGFKEQRDEKL